MLFNKFLTGGEELRNLLGFIDATTNFERWITWVELSVRQVTNIVGTAVYNQANDHYNSDNYKHETSQTPTDDTDPTITQINQWKILDTLVQKFQLANALFAYVKLLPSLDAGHSNAGRIRTVGTEDRTLTAVEAYKDENNILNLAYESVEDLIQYLETTQNQAWLTSQTQKSTANLLVPNLETFNQYFHIGSARLFFTLVPMLNEIQNLQITPTITATRLTSILTAFVAETPTTEQATLIALTQNYIRRPMILATMALALKRLPVEILPEGWGVKNV